MEEEIQSLILHKYRKKEVKLIFKGVPKNAFKIGLELGSGDGFQSTLLKRCISDLTCTEYNWNRLKKRDKDITYMKCDAENIDAYFRRKMFDIVFSSNLLEHLQNKQLALKGINKILKDDGITIHVMPNLLWKISMLILFYPILLICLPRRIMIRIIKMKNKKIKIEKEIKNDVENNLKFQKKGKWFLTRIIFPQPHGAYRSNIEEILEYRRNKWIKELKKSGFKIIKIIKGPFCFGYSYALLDKVSVIFEKIGLCTEYIYIAKKIGQKSKYEHLFIR